MPTSASMTDEEFQLLNELIERYFGIQFPAHKRNLLASRLAPRMELLHLANFMEYHRLLAAHANGERSHLAQLVTNNETYFFREPYQFEALVNEGITSLRDRLVSPSQLRILCAGCSSGEEAFTLSFYTHDHTGQCNGLRPVIDAFDVDEERVNIARRGRFRPRSLREMTPGQTAMYLEPAVGNEFQVKSAYSDVRFSIGNIVETRSFLAPVQYDVIFCRNVLIYFSDVALRAAVENLAESLRLGGLLFLGHSESIIGMFDHLEAIRVGNCIAYQKVTP